MNRDISIFLPPSLGCRNNKWKDYGLLEKDQSTVYCIVSLYMAIAIDLLGRQRRGQLCEMRGQEGRKLAPISKAFRRTRLDDTNPPTDLNKKRVEKKSTLFLILEWIGGLWGWCRLLYESRCDCAAQLQRRSFLALLPVSLFWTLVKRLLARLFNCSSQLGLKLKLKKRKEGPFPVLAFSLSFPSPLLFCFRFCSKHVACSQDRRSPNS